MARPDHLRALSWAHVVALRAQLGPLPAQDVQDLAGFVSTRLTPDHPASRAVKRFVDRFRLAAYDPPALALLGVELQGDVIRALRPDPVDVGRADIHG